MHHVMTYHGRKLRIAKHVLRFLRPARIYCEPFCGSAVVWANVPEGAYTSFVLNDRDRRIHNLMLVLRDERLFTEFLRRLHFTYYHTDEYTRCIEVVHSLRPEDMPSVDAAVCFVMLLETTVGGQVPRTPGEFTISSTSGKLQPAARLHKSFWHYHRRLQQSYIFCMDGIDLIDRIDREDVIFYIDPPYPPESRGDRGYANDMTYNDHERLVDRLTRLKGKAVVSTYPCDLYDRLLCYGWRKHSIEVSGTFAAQANDLPRLEVIYENTQPDLFTSWTEPEE